MIYEDSGRIGNIWKMKLFLKILLSRSLIKTLEDGCYEEICTRFPPEPNGYLHIGHAKSILLNYGLAKKYGGKFHLRLTTLTPQRSGPNL